MTIHSHDFTVAPSGFAAVLRAMCARLGQNAVSTVIAWKNRRLAARSLAGMDDRMLADIGVTRSDLRSALSAPLWQDPTVQLRLLAVERRAAFQASARERISGGVGWRRDAVPVIRGNRAPLVPDPSLTFCGEPA